MENSEEGLKGITRRELLKQGTVLGLVGVISRFIPTHKSAPDMSQMAPTQPAQSIQPRTHYEEEHPNIPLAVETKTRPIDYLNKIALLPLDNPERQKVELGYLDLVKTIPEIDLGLMVIYDQNIRQKLLDKRFELRPNKAALGKYLDWVKKQDSHPEIMGMCLDAYPQAKELIDKQLKTDHPEISMLNLGGMLGLVNSETSSFTDFGNEPAYKKLGERDLSFFKELIERIMVDTSLNLVLENIPGSTAGALGLQFMPGTALDVYKKLDKLGFKFNPLHPISSIVGAWYLLATRGYQKENAYFTLSRVWNNHDIQTAKIVASNDSFAKNFPS